nr:Smr/MutS family protein [Sphingomonas sp. R-74633]
MWKRVVASVTPIKARPVKSVEALEKAAPVAPAPVLAKPKPKGRVPAPRPVAPPLAPARGQAANTLDGSWDRRLSRGLVAPESTVDLHGHSLSSAYDRLDFGLEAAIARGDRVLLLVTGKAPRPESERPHARGAIRAAVGDWLGASRFSDRIAAVRSAHSRHGGAGALYIVLRRPREKS